MAQAHPREFAARESTDRIAWPVRSIRWSHASRRPRSLFGTCLMRARRTAFGLLSRLKSGEPQGILSGSDDVRLNREAAGTGQKIRSVWGCIACVCLASSGRRHPGSTRERRFESPTQSPRPCLRETTTRHLKFRKAEMVYTRQRRFVSIKRLDTVVVKSSISSIPVTSQRHTRERAVMVVPSRFTSSQGLLSIFASIVLI